MTFLPTYYSTSSHLATVDLEGLTTVWPSYGEIYPAVDSLRISTYESGQYAYSSNIITTLLYSSRVYYYYSRVRIL